MVLCVAVAAAVAVDVVVAVVVTVAAYFFLPSSFYRFFSDGFVSLFGFYLVFYLFFNSFGLVWFDRIRFVCFDV